jgi:hypothetical protein
MPFQCIVRIPDDLQGCAHIAHAKSAVIAPDTRERFVFAEGSDKNRDDINGPVRGAAVLRSEGCDNLVKDL